MSTDPQFPPGDRLFALIASIPGSGTIDWCGPARALLDEIAAAPVTVPPADRAGLRERIAEALLDHLSRTADIRPGKTGQLAFMPEINDPERQRIADAVLAALPAELAGLPAAVDRAAGERLARIGEWVTSDVVTANSGFGDGYREAQRDIRDLMNGPIRMATETPGPETQGALMRAHVALAEQAGRDQAALARVRRLHDSLAAETDLTSPDDQITRGAAARRIATALDGWNPAGLPGCDAEFEGGGRCAKPAGHRPPGSDDPHVPQPAVVAEPGKETTS